MCRLQISLPITIKKIKLAVELQTKVRRESQCFIMDGMVWDKNYEEDDQCTKEELKGLSVFISRANDADNARQTIYEKDNCIKFTVTHTPELSTDTDSGGSNTELKGKYYRIINKMSTYSFHSICRHN